MSTRDLYQALRSVFTAQMTDTNGSDFVISCGIAERGETLVLTFQGDLLQTPTPQQLAFSWPADIPAALLPADPLIVSLDPLTITTHQANHYMHNRFNVRMDAFGLYFDLEVTSALYGFGPVPFPPPPDQLEMPRQQVILSRQTLYV